MNKSFLKINREVNDDLSTKWKLITLKKKRRFVDKSTSNSISEFISKKIGLMVLYYKKKFPKASIKKMGWSVKKLTFSQTALIATQNNVGDSLTNNTINAAIQIATTQNIESKLWLKRNFSTYCNTKYAKTEKQTWFFYFINQ